MRKKNKNISKIRVIGIIVFIISILLLVAFIILTLQNNVLTETMYSVAVFLFVFGMLGAVSSFSLILIPNNKKSDASKEILKKFDATRK